MQSIYYGKRHENTRETIWDSGNSAGRYVSLYHTCGSLCVARVKELPIVLEFTSFQDTIMFHRRGRFGLEKVQNNEIHVKVILDMECGNI